MASGSLGSAREPTLHWSAAQAETRGRMRISTSSGPRMPVTAWRCETCGIVELVAEPI